MRNRYALLLGLVPLLLVLSCTKRIQVTSYPHGQVPLTGALEFVFSESIAPADSVGMWTNTPYLNFEPAVTGSFRWRARNILTFVPTGSNLSGAQAYIAKPNPELLLGRKFKLSPAEFSFHTAGFQAVSMTTSWNLEPSYNSGSPVTIQLRFSYPVDPEMLRDKIELYSNGTKVENISFYHYAAHTDYDINADLDNSIDGPQILEIRLKPGLQSVLNRAPLTEMQILRDTLSPISELQINSLYEEFENGKYQIKIGANQGLASDRIKSYITIDPEMPFQLNGDGKNVVIESDFKPNHSYTIAIRSGMPGSAGGKLLKDYTYTLKLPGLKPFVKFADDKGHFLMRNGYENLNLKATNVQNVQVRLYEIYENNLLQFLENNPGNFKRYSYFKNTEEYFYGRDYSYLEIDRYGALIHEETLALPEAAENEIIDFPLKLEKQFRNKFKGIFAIEILNAEGENWVQDYKIVSLSDIGLIAKWNDEDILVFANYLSTARPAVGAKISLISETNQAYLTGVADGEGVVRFKNVGQRWQQQTFSPSMITAQTADDFQFLDLNRTQIYHDRFDIEGKEKSSYEVFCYGDRTLYRPGDTLHFSAIVRDWDYGSPQGLPVTMHIRNPEGNSIKELQVNTNAGGAIEFAFPIDEQSRTGSYNIDLQTGLESSYASYEFQVEDFVPDKIKVQLKAERASGKPGDTLLFPLEGAYYFGAKCAEHRYEMKYKLVYANYRSKRFPQFDFKEEAAAGQYEWGESSGTLDSLGLDTARYIVPTDLHGAGILTGRATATVWDNTGHTVRAAKGFSIASRNKFLGLREHGRYFRVGENFNADFVAVNYADMPVKGQELIVQLTKFDWNRALRQDGSGFYYVSESQSVPLLTDTLRQGEDFLKFSKKIEQPGNYEFTVQLMGEQRKQRIQFSAYGQKAATESSFGVKREGTVAITFDKDAYKVGETARILFTAPFSGRMLVTIERDKVHEYRYVDVVNNAAEISFTIKDSHVPNMWVSTTLFRPQRNALAIPVTVAHGYAGVKVDNPQRKNQIKIIAPAQIRPGTVQNIEVKATPGSFVTVAVVDEGVLAIKHYATPDPYAFMYQARELEVRSYDMYDLLLPEVPSLPGATGGSDIGEMSTFPHMNPIRTKRYKPFAYWSGILKADGAGRVQVKVPFPAEFSGKARIMVTAYKDAQFGSAETGIIARNDLVVMPAIPRFLIVGDSLEMPVNLMNMTSKEGLANIELRVEGPLVVTTALKQSTKIGPERNADMHFALKAQKAGEATITFLVDGIEKNTLRIPITIKPAKPFESDGQTGKIVAGQQLRLQIPAGYDPDLQMTVLAISPTPALEFGEQLQYLLQYPYGCLEQTVSAALPQLYFEDLSEMIDPEKYKNTKAIHHVREAIKKVESMQLYHGGFSYWQGGGDSYENSWASVYATHFLLEAQKAGFAVQESVLKRALEHLQTIANEGNYYSYHYQSQGNSKVSTKAAKEQIYSLFVLALAKMPDLPLMNYYKSHLEMLTQDGSCMLASAFALQGDKASFQLVLPAGQTFERPERLTGGSFDSPMRNAGIMLSTLAEAAPNSDRIPAIIEYIRANRQELKTTQDNGWIFMGLGKLSRNRRSSSTKVSVVEGGKSLLQYDGANTHISLANGSGKALILTASGKGEAYYYLKIKGLKSGNNSQVTEKDQVLKIRREWYTTEGDRIHDLSFNLGELVVCKLVLESKSAVDNIAISDLIPAGFEVENPRLTGDDYAWITGAVKYNHHDIRDDRVDIFTACTGNISRQFSYLIRAVNVGRFVQPAVQAEAMYDPMILSIHNGSSVQIYDRDYLLPRNRVVATQAEANTDSGKVNSASDLPIWDRFMQQFKK